MSARVLILTAGFGEGHNAAARAIAAACDERHGAGTARIADVFEMAAPRLNRLARRSYIGIINRAPGLWNSIYQWFDRSPSFPTLARALRGERRTLRQLLAAGQPEVICSTYPVYAFLLAQLSAAERGNAPHHTVVTDSISINSLWWRAGADGWFVPNEDSAAVMRAQDVDAARVHVTGFPVSAFFAENFELRPPSLGAGAGPRVLYIINSGTRGAAETARRLLLDTDWEITCTVGRDEALRTELMRLATERPAPARILGWTREIPRLLMTHHVVVSKAGGATTQEALAARCPMVVNQIVPGQEEGNYELLRRHNIGALAETPEAVINALRRAFADHGRGWAEWRRAIEPLCRPEAAHDIAGRLLAARAPAREPVPIPLRPLAASA